MQKQIAYFSTHWPQYQSSASSVRTINLLHALRSLLPGQNKDKSILMCSPQKLSNEKLKESLQQEFTNLEMCTQPINEGLMSSKDKLQNPQVVVFDTFVSEEYYGRDIRSKFPHSLTICDTQDIRSLRFLRESLMMDRSVTNIMFHDFDSVRNTLNAQKEHLLFSEEFKNVFPDVNNQLFLRELSSIWRSDASLVVSSREIEFLHQVCKVPNEKMLLSPFIFTRSSGNGEEKPSFSRRKHFIHIGSFRHPPNRDSVLVLKYHLWPRIRSQLGDDSAELHIYGSYTSQEFIDLDDKRSGFRIKKLLLSIEKMQKYRVNLAPLRFGAGIKGKIADGWSEYTPCVTTWIGAEGMNFEPHYSFAGLIAEKSWDEFVAHSVSLYLDECLWTEQSLLAKNISTSPESYLSNEKSSELLHNYLANELVNGKKTLDYTSAVVRSQDNKNEYMSKYLQLKKELQK